MLVNQPTYFETKEVEEIRNGQKCKVRYLEQKRMMPVRKEAVELLEKLKARMETLDAIKAQNTNGQNLVTHAHGIVFNEGNREDTVISKLVKDKDVANLQKLEKDRLKTTETKIEQPKKMSQLAQIGTEQGDIQHTFRVLNLAMSGNTADPFVFARGKNDFEDFLQNIKEEIFQKKKIRVRFNTNFRKSMHTDLFMGVVNFYFEDRSHAELVKNELEGAVYNGYEIMTEWFERRPQKRD
jgi:hypothetical protein